jgi:integrase
VSKDKAMRGITRRGRVYWLNVQRNNKRKWVSLKTSDPAQAIREATRYRKMPEVRSGGLWIADVVERFVREMKSLRERGSRRGWARRTADSKIYVLRIFAKFVGRTIPDRVTSEDVRRFYSSRLRERNAQTAYGNYMTVRSFFRWCVEERMVHENPCLAVKVEAPPRVARKDFAEPELVEKLIAECPRQDLKYVLFCGFHAGMRFLEIVESVPWWFDLGRRLIRMGKTPTIQFKDLEERNVPMSEAFYRFVKEEYGLQEPFMLHPENEHGKNRYRYDFTRPFREYMKAQGCEWITPHIMRHTFASLLASMDPKLGGPSDFEIMSWMGVDWRTYQRTYAKLRPRRGALDKAFQVSPSSKPGHRSSAASISSRS